jgi:MinD-like ATPase involved in chromosome partitioning or flagellar assembly
VAVGVLVALGGAPFEAVALGAVGRGRTHVVRRCVDIADLLATAASGQGDVALVSTYLAGLDRQAVDALEAAGVAVVGVVASGSDPACDALRRIGAGALVVVDDVDGFEGSIAAAAAAGVGRDLAGASSRHTGVLAPHPTARHGDDDRARGQVIAVWGPTGAPGRSVVALGLGASIADLGTDALVVDADVYGGSLAQHAGVLDEASGLLAAARAANAGSLDPAALARRCLRLGPRLRVLTGLPRADRWVEAKAVLVRGILDSARGLVDHTVVDCGFSLEVDEEVMYDTRAPRRNGATIEILTQADVVVVVGAADPVGLSRLIRAVGDLAETVPRAELRIVVNRLREGIGWSAEAVESMLRRTAGVGVAAFLPDDPAACDRALVAGKTLLESAPERPVSRRLRELAAEITGLPLPSRRRRRGRPPRQGKKSSQSPVTV